MTSTQEPGNAGRAPQENTMTQWDGTELFYRAWLPAAPTRKAMILFHRGHEHSGRFQDVVDALDMNDLAIFAWDARGHGRSPGDRGYAPSFHCMVKDVEHFVRHVCATYEFAMQDIVVLAHSVGAVTVAAWVHDYAPPIRALVLCTPALRVKLYVPLAIPALRLMQKLRPGKKSYVKSYVKAKMLTHDPDQAKRYDEDPLIARAIAVNILLDLHDSATRIIDDAGAIRVPTLLLSGGADWVVKRDAQQRLFDRLGSPSKRMRTFDGMYHDILHEKDRHLVLDEIRSFAEEAYASFEPPEPMLDADERGYTKSEYDRLCKPLSPLSPKGLAFAFQRFAFNTVGRLSDGVRLGFETGFDSGTTLDYVYENQPRGRLGIGKLIDRGYLNSVGWTGIRARKVNLETLLQDAVERVRQSGRPVRLVDIATGCGRYILDTIRKAGGDDFHALLRDYKERNLETGRALAAEMGIENVTFQHGDAFDEESLASLDPSPNIAVVSGLYELFPENEAVRRSLRGLSRALQPGGYLVYTGQPWHPQVEMIARTLKNREGDYWIMRRRTQQEMDDLVQSAGFEKITMEIDAHGIFTVSLARLSQESTQ